MTNPFMNKSNIPADRSKVKLARPPAPCVMIPLSPASLENRTMKSFLACALLGSAFLGAAVAADPTEKWEKEIAAMEARDKAAPPGGIVFVGSSSIRLWDLKKSFPELPALNHGFGGSTTPDAVKFAERLITAFQPKTVVFYSGDNDLATGRKPEQFEADVKELVKLIHAKLPEAKILLLPIKPSPSRAKLRTAQDDANRRLKKLAAGDPRLTYVDIVAPMLDSDGNPRPELFRDDKLHLNADGYAVWNKVLEPLLK